MPDDTPSQNAILVSNFVEKTSPPSSILQFGTVYIDTCRSVFVQFTPISLRSEGNGDLLSVLEVRVFENLPLTKTTTSSA